MYIYIYNTLLYEAEHTDTNTERTYVLVLSNEKGCDICYIVFSNQNRYINILVSLTNDLGNRCLYLTSKCTFYFQKDNSCFSAQ